MVRFTRKDTTIHGCYLIKGNRFKDERGSFDKLFSHDLFESLGIDFCIREIFLSTSRANVLRGMHFQVPPHHHHKLISCIRGRVLDVVLDLRKGSETFRRFQAFELGGEDDLMLFVPAGLAHGFLALEEDSTMFYATSTEHVPESDLGIRWDSFGFSWPCSNPIISSRDAQHPTLDEFVTPFE